MTEVPADRPAPARAGDARGVLAAGRTLVPQAGDRAEDPAECTAEHIARERGGVDARAL
ncbi:hypothetical protein AB0G15_00745 [Streptosporangium sp. NPDC023825]|uniref:hypothetical protein n=1 Tax=Streptosporangium sp. NPDC023825 TaxID=3154909 RepID=UPI0034201190